MPPVVAAAGAAATWFAAQNIVVQLAIRVAAGFVLSAAATALMGKSRPSTPVFSDPGRQESVRQALSPRRVVYGETKVGGTIFYVETTGGDNKYLSVLTAHCAREIGGFDELFFGPEALEVDGNDISSADHTRYDDRAWAYTHLGTADQVADAEMLARTAGGWTSAHRARGVAYSHLLLKWKPTGTPSDPDETPTNIWSRFSFSDIAWRLRGALLYDTRDAGTRYSQNPALALRDYLVTYLNVTSAEINDTVTSASANVCDEQVALVNTTKTFTASASTDALTLTSALENLRRGNVVRVSTDGALPSGLSAGTDYYLIPVSRLRYKLATSYANALAGTSIDLADAGTGTHTLTLRSEPRYTAAAIIESTDNPADVIRSLLASMSGVLTYTGGKFEIHAGASVASSATFDIDDFGDAALQIVWRRPRRELFNRCKGSYVDPDKAYKPTTSPPVTNATYLSQDNAEPIWKTVELPFVDSPARAQRLAKIDLERCRQQIVTRVPLNLRGVQVKPWDVVAITHATYGWSAKEFRILEMGIEPDGATSLLLAEEASSMWTWSAEETAVDPAPDTNLPAASTVTAPPTPVMFSEELRETAGGVITVLRASINPSPDQFVSHYSWQWQVSGDTVWRSLPNAGMNVEIAPVEDAAAISVRVASVNWIGRVSDFITGSTVIIGQSAKPAVVENFSVNVIGAVAVMAWDPNTEVDLAGYRIKYNLATTGATWSNSVDLFPGGEGGKPRVSRNMTSKTTPAVTGTYLIKAVDYKGNESATVTSRVITIETLPNINFIATATEDPGYAGTHSETVSVGGFLQLDGADTLADWASLDIIPMMALGDGAGFALEGTYTFATKIDLGAYYLRSLVTQQLVVDAEDYGNLIGTWPSMGSIQQMGSLDPGDYEVATQCRVTDDDPNAVSPTWSEWQDFVTGEYAGRGYDFRIRLRRFQANVTPRVEECRIQIDMPDRFEKGEDLTTAVGGTAVTFGQRFKVTPNVALTWQNLATGDYGTLVSKSATGFTARAFNAAGAGVARLLDWRAQGY